jgi:cell division transport system permease protein
MAPRPTKAPRKKKLGSYPHLMVIFSVTLALFVVGLFGVLLIHAGQLSRKVKESIEMQVYLERNLTETQLIRLKKVFGLKEYIAYKDNVPQVFYIPKEEGARRLIGEINENFMTILEDNPLRDAFVLKVNEEYADSQNLKKIQQDLQNISGVFEVVYIESFIGSITNNLRTVSLILLSFAAILTLVVVILINNTIKLALFSQRFLIRSMQLVGATSYFIQRPFLKRATFQGFVSGMLASGLLFLLLQYAYFEMSELYLLRDEKQMFFLMGALVVLGSVIGFLSSYRAVRKYLRLSLDELY